jgi:hypothetical protein
VVNANTKVNIPGREDPVIFEVNYATLVDDNDEYESLVVPFEIVLIMRNYTGIYLSLHKMTWIL